MSWLRNHMRHFVLPGVHTIARRGGGTALLDRDIKPSDRTVRPSTKCKYVEAGMLYAVASSVLPKGNETREVALGLCRQIGQGDDAEFVYELDLGGRGDYTGERVKKLAEGYEGVEGADVLHSFIMNSVKELKRRSRKQGQAIYPGRDVWCWEVMSRRLGMPSHYDSRVSRSIATNPKAIESVVKGWKGIDWEKAILFDTGHQGTVPRAIGQAAGLEKMIVVMLSAVENEEQIFRTHAKSRKKALACEYLAKYRKRATVRDDAPYQELAELEEFIKAALLTIWLWYHVSPARLPAWKDQPAVPSFKKKDDKSTFTIAPSGSLSVPTQPVMRFSGTNTGPIWVNSGTSATTVDTNIMWDNTATTTGGGWLLDATTFQLVDPATGAVKNDPWDLAAAQYTKSKYKAMCDKHSYKDNWRKKI